VQFSNSLEYAVHGLIYMTTADSSGRAVLLREMAEAIRVPESYLRKVFQSLARAKLVLSQRGVGGGYYLGRTPEEITLADVLVAVEGSLPVYRCLRQRRNCEVAEPCLVRETFKVATARMEDVLQGVSLADLAADLGQRADPLGWLEVTASAR
jgi:Rrf2 family protein